MTTNSNIDRYAVFGNPISHSLSPQLHKIFAQQTQQTIDYSAHCIEENDFCAQVKAFFASGGKGLNITVPFKQSAYELADTLTERARTAGAVNTLFINEQSQLVGDNTDGSGLIQAIAAELEWPIRQKRLLILGAGGAVRGVLQPLIEQQPISLTIANRTYSKAKALSELFSGTVDINACGFSDIPKSAFDLVINASSASLSGELPPIPIELIAPTTHCYDMMYSQKKTLFLQWASDLGCKNISDGLGMLVGQGAESFFIWRGIRPDVGAAIKTLGQKPRTYS